MTIKSSKNQIVPLSVIIMKANVLLISPRYIKHEYFDFLLKAMNIHKVYSFMNKLPRTPFESLWSKFEHSVSSNQENENYNNNIEGDWVLSPAAQQWREISHDEYWNFINLIIDDIEQLLKAPEKIQKNPNRIFERPTIIVIADWEPCGRHFTSGRRAFFSYDLFIKGINHREWNRYENTAFPFTNEFGDLSEHIVKRLSDKLCSDKDKNLLEQVSIIKTSVFFKHKDKLSLIYDYRDATWHVKFVLGKHKGKVYNFTQALHLRAAHIFPDIFVNQNHDGKKTLVDIYRENTDAELHLWARYNSLEEEFYGDDDYNTYSQVEDTDGCGYGWSCNNCPNYGCPSNELN